MITLDQLIGMPHRPDARGPDAYDCLGLAFVVFREVYGIAIPEIPPGVHYHSRKDVATTAATLASWQPADPASDPAPLLVTMATSPHHPRLIDHVAVYIGGGRIIHSSSKTGCVIERVRTWQDYIRGYYAWR